MSTTEGFADLIDGSPLGFVVIEQPASSGTQGMPFVAWCNERAAVLLGNDAATMQARPATALFDRLEPATGAARLLEAIIAGEPFHGLLSRTVPMLVRGGASTRSPRRYLLWLSPVHGLGDAPAIWQSHGRPFAENRGEALYFGELDIDGGFRLAWIEPGMAWLLGERLQTGTGWEVLARDLDLDGRARLARRNRRLAGGEACRVVYALPAGAGGTIDLIEDSARPVLDPDTREVIGCVGRIRNLGERIGLVRSGIDAALALAKPSACWLLFDREGLIHWSLLQLPPDQKRVVMPPPERLADLLGRQAAGQLLGWHMESSHNGMTVGHDVRWSLPGIDVLGHVEVRPLPHDLALARLDPDARDQHAQGSDARPLGSLVFAMVTALDAAAVPALLVDSDLVVLATGAVTRARAPEIREDEPLGNFMPEADAARLADALTRLDEPGQRQVLDNLHLPAIAMQAMCVSVVRIAAPEACYLLLPEPVEEATTVSRGHDEEDDAWARVLMDGIADGILSTTIEGKIESISPSAQHIFGITADKAIGQPLASLIAEGANTEIDLTVLLDDPARQEGAYEMLARRPGGTLVPVEVFVRTLRYRGRRIAIVTVRDITARRQAEETIKNLAYHDLLTGLPNRLLFYDRLRHALDRGRRGAGVIAVMLIDLDRFKLINDSLGLQRGDEVLKGVAERFSSCLNEGDAMARLGGDEFMLVVTGEQNAGGVTARATELLDKIKPPLTIDGHELTVNASIGIALFPHDGDEPEVLIKNADTALSRAKETGRGRYQFYTNDMNTAAFERLMLESRLRRALAQEELVVHYQPQIKVDSGQVIGVEALLRWYHPELGMVPPGEFIPAAEETGLIVPIGLWALRESCRQVQVWRRSGLEQLRLSVNLSASQFRHDHLVHDIGQVLTETDFDPALLELELTESVIMQQSGDTISRLRELTDLGLSLAVDDFGTGYSSLAYLKRFPIRSLKIDRSFVRDIDSDQNSAAIAKAIVALGSSLSLNVVAEGVETEAQLELLESYGCDEMQGFLFSRPLAPDDTLAFLIEHKATTNVRPPS